MKKPKLSEMTLREKIGQTYIMREYTYKYTDDYKKYFEENPVGCLWSCGETRDDFTKVEADLGRGTDATYIDDMQKDLVNVVVNDESLLIGHVKVRTANVGFDTCDQLKHREGLGHIIVSTLVQSFYGTYLIGLCTHDDNRDFFVNLSDLC